MTKNAVPMATMTAISGTSAYMIGKRVGSDTSDPVGSEVSTSVPVGSGITFGIHSKPELHMSPKQD